ncbi:hypothetical protein HDR66_02100 [bacterium]|nr:hypothetical protein [bacterium]
MRKTAVGVMMAMTIGVAMADEIIIENSECESERKSDNLFYISAGLDINARTRETISVMGYRFHEKQKYKLDAPNVSFGIDWDDNVIGVNINMREMPWGRMRNITSVIELPILPFDTTPYMVGEAGVSDIKLTVADVCFRDRAFLYGGGIGLRINTSDNTFIKFYNIWSRAHFRDRVYDTPVKIYANHRRFGLSVGYTF